MSDSILSFIYIPIILIIGFTLTHNVVKRTGVKLIYLFYIEHFVLSYFYYLFAQNNNADSNMYYRLAAEGGNLLESFGTDTKFIVFLATFFVKIGFSKISLFFLFGLFGFIGAIYLIKMLDYNFRLKLFGFPMVFLILLLPGFHFWTSALGKDSIIFMSLMLFFYGLKKINKRYLLILLAFFLLAIIRPHLAMVMLIAIVLTLFFRNPLTYDFSHIFLGFIMLGLSILFLPYFLDFINIDKLEMNAINEKIEFYTSYGASKTDNLNSYIDVRSYSLPNKMFAYLFRPLFFDANSILQLLASFENLFLLVLVFKWLKSIRFKVFTWYKLLRDTDKVLFIYLLVGWAVLSAGMYNLGLASRQKYMLLPVLFILIFKNLSYTKVLKSDR